MKLNVVFTYPVSYVPFRAQNTRHAHFRSATDVEIREVDEAAVRDAFLVSDPGHARFKPKQGRPRRMVSFEGKLWLERGDAAKFAEQFADGGTPDHTPFRACGHLKFKDQRDTKVLDYIDERELRRQNPAPMRSYENDGGAKMARRIARRAEDIIVVGGTVYVRDLEPVWQVERGALKLGTVPADDREPFTDAYRTYASWSDCRVRADRRDEAEAVWAASADRRPVEASIEILDPSLVRYNDAGRALSHSLGNAARLLSAHMPVLPTPLAEAFLDIRDAMSATGGAVGPALEPVAERVVALYGIEAEIPDTREKAQEARGSVKSAIDACRDAFGRWERRRDDGHEWVHLGLPRTTTRHGSRIVREVLDTDSAGRLAENLGVDLSEAVASASAGSGRLFSVDEQWVSYSSYHPEREYPLSAVMVRDGADGPEVAWSLGVGGGPCHEGDEQVVQGHLLQCGADAALRPATAQPARTAP